MQEDAQRAAPMAGGTPPSPVSGGGAAQGAPPAQPNIFAPTERPNEPLTAGAELLPPDPVAHIRALYARFPNDDLRRLLERASERR